MSKYAKDRTMPRAGPISGLHIPPVNLGDLLAVLWRRLFS
jgi:hypothetical protein